MPLMRLDNGNMKILIPFLLICSLCWTTGVYADENAALNQAMRAFNNRARSDADKNLILRAVSQQTKVPEKALETQMRTSHLNYAELLTAESIADGSGKSVASIVALKAQGQNWTAISKNLKIDPNSIAARLSNAEKSVRLAQAKAGQKTAPSKVYMPGGTDIRRSSTGGPQPKGGQ